MEVGMIDISVLHRAEKILVRLLVHIHTITQGVKNNGPFFNQFCNILVTLPPTSPISTRFCLKAMDNSSSHRTNNGFFLTFLQNFIWFQKSAESPCLKRQ